MTAATGGGSSSSYAPVPLLQALRQALRAEPCGRCCRASGATSETDEDLAVTAVEDEPIKQITATVQVLRLEYLQGASSDPLGTPIPTASWQEVDFSPPSPEGFVAAPLGRLGPKKKSKKRKSLDDPNWLSSVPEVQADVQYRFLFRVTSRFAAHIVEAACTSLAATLLLQASANSLPDPDSPTRQHSAGSSIFSERSVPDAPDAIGCRCLSPVPYPWESSHGSRLKLAKLSFSGTDRGLELPECSSRLEALGSAIVFLLFIDPPEGDETFGAQLGYLARCVKAQRARKHRPCRALLLIHSGAKKPEELVSWEAVVASFEKEYGVVPKFGPLTLQDADGLHSVFATIASDTITKNWGT